VSAQPTPLHAEELIGRARLCAARQGSGYRPLAQITESSQFDIHCQMVLGGPLPALTGIA